MKLTKIKKLADWFIPPKIKRLFRGETTDDRKSYLGIRPEYGTGGTRKDKKNIICIVLDGVSRHSMVDAPNTNRFFENGVICEKAYTQAYWTLPAFSSMLTGLYPLNHGILGSEDRIKVKILPEYLLENGFRTFAYSSHKRFIPIYGHAKGFERFIFRSTNQEHYYPTAINEVILHLEKHKNESNFILLYF